MRIESAPCDEASLRSGAGPCATAPADRPWVLAASILASGVGFLNGSVVSIALPAIQQDLGATLAGIQWILNSYALLLGALILASGAAGDRYGRRRIFRLGLSIFSLGSIACALAPGTTSLIAARSLQGLGSAMYVPASLALLSAAYPAESRGRAIGTWSALTSVAVAIGPIAGGAIVDRLSWRFIFVLEIPLAAAALAIAFARVPESRAAQQQQQQRAPLDWPGALLATLGLAGLTYGLISSQHRGWGDAAVVSSLALGGALLVLFVAVERRARDPLVPLGLFASRTFLGANLLTLFLYFSLTGVLVFLPFDLIQVQGYSAAAAGAALLPFTLLLAGLSRWSGGLADRYGPRAPLAAGSTMVAAAFAWMAAPGIGGSYWTTFFPGIVLLGLGMAVTVAPLTATVMGAVEPQQIGAASGINNSVSRVAGLLAVAILGLLLAGLFRGALVAGLERIAAAPALREWIVERSENLAATPAPDWAAGPAREAAREAILQAFVRAFRIVMLICAAGAAASGASALLLIPPRTARPRAPQPLGRAEARRTQRRSAPQPAASRFRAGA